MKKVILITGGARSGKSQYAEELALSLSKNPVYVATAHVWDDEFCERVKKLPFEKPLEITCDYNNIRRFCICSFMDYDARDIEKVKVSSMDQDIFSWCREIALKLAEELGKTYLPKV